MYNKTTSTKIDNNMLSQTRTKAQNYHGNCLPPQLQDRATKGSLYNRNMETIDINRHVYFLIVLHRVYCNIARASRNAIEKGQWQWNRKQQSTTGKRWEALHGAAWRLGTMVNHKGNRQRQLIIAVELKMHSFCFQSVEI
jgi:hypothetical protein